VIVREEHDQAATVGGSRGAAYLGQLLGRSIGGTRGALRGDLREKACCGSSSRRRMHILRDAYAPHEEANLVLDKAEKRIFDIGQQKVGGAMVRGDGAARSVRDDENPASAAPKPGFSNRRHAQWIAEGRNDHRRGAAVDGQNGAGDEHDRRHRGRSDDSVRRLLTGNEQAQLAQRMLCSRGSIDSHKLRKGMLQSRGVREAGERGRGTGEAPVWVDDSPGLTILICAPRRGG